MKIDRKGNVHDERGLFAKKNAVNIFAAKSLVRPVLFKIPLTFFSEENLDSQGPVQLKKGIRNLQKRMEEHYAKINNPEKLYSNWHLFDDTVKNGIIAKWNREIIAFKQAIANREAKLKEREDKK